MAVAKSTINAMTGTTESELIQWSSLASGANNTYFDVNGKATGKVIFLVLNTNSTDVGTTAGGIYFGASATNAAGTSGEDNYSARSLGRFLVRHAPPTTVAKEFVTPSTAAAGISISAFGPFESARLKDTDGYIKVCKEKASSDAGRVKIAAILLP